jgi:hypothetical protein
MHKMLAGRALSFVLSVPMFALLPVHPAAAQSSRPQAAKPDKPGGGSKPCNPRKQTCPDITPPAIAIAIPSSGSTVAGIVTVSGTAADAVGVTIVEVQVDNDAFQLATGTTTWTSAFDSRFFADGAHTIRARAGDAAGNVSAVASVSVSVNNTTTTGPNVLVVSHVAVDRPTLHALGVQVLISGDDNRNARIDVRYRRASDTVWRQGPPLMRVMPETITEVVPQQFAGTVFDLDPGTEYEIELHATDVDGGVDETRSVLATTRGVPPADPASARTIQVANATALRVALTAAQPGDILLLDAGTYSGTFFLGASGTAARPIVVRGVSTGGVVLDGGNCASCNILEVAGSYVHVERLSIANGFRGLRFTGANATGNVARRLSISNVVHGTASSTGQTDFYICDNTIDGRLQWPWVLQGNPTLHWDDRGIEVTGDGHVVCHNSIRGFGDPVLNMKRRARSWDIYGNDIADAWDGVELDEGEGNVRLFHNRFTNVMAPISIQPMFGGPGYALRNVAFNVPDEQIKLKSLGGVEEPSGVLAYHNTLVSPERALNLLSTIAQHNFVFANNLFVGPDALWDARSVDWRARLNRGLFDYNGYFPDGHFMFGTVSGVDRLFTSFAQAQAGGVEPNGTLLGSSIFQGGFVGPANEEFRHAAPDFSLAPASNAVDRGARLLGINDGFTGTAPDLGALELGCPVPVYGPRPEGLETYTWRINCLTDESPLTLFSSVGR